MTIDEQNFFKKFDIDYNKLLEKSADNNNAYIFNDFEINPIVASYGIFVGKSEKRMVSVADILGYNMRSETNIFKSIPNFFETDGDGYHSRSIGLLNYSSDEIMGQLKSSFEKEPISLQEIKNNKYIISNNGLHRFTVVRIHYLMEMRLATNETKAHIKNKYSFPCIVSTYDKIKTYCNYILCTVSNGRSHISLDYDSNYVLTGKSSVLYDNKNIILNDNGLLNFTATYISNYLPDNDFAKLKISKQINENEEFKDFIKNNFTDNFNSIVSEKENPNA